MKKITLYISFLMLSFCVFAQSESAFYLTHSYSLGNNLGGDLDFNYINDNQYSFTLGVKLQLSFNKDFPSDYDDTSDFLFLPSLESMSTFYFLAGKVFPEGKYVRFNLQGGLGASIVDTSANFVRGKQVDDGLYDYEYDNINERALSLVLRPKLEITAPQVIGLYLYGELIANKYNSYYGVGLGIMLGKVR